MNWRVKSISEGVERTEIVDGSQVDIFADCENPAQVATRYEEFWNQLDGNHPPVTVIKVERTTEEIGP